MTPAEVKRAIRQSSLTPIRRGWYGMPGCDPNVRRAVELGGALTCWQALGPAGAWEPVSSDGLLHVRVPERAGALKLAKVHTAPVAAGRCPILDPIDPPALAALCAVKCLPRHEVVAILDSMIRAGIMHPDDVYATLEYGGWTGRRVASSLDPSAESGLESILRLRLSALRVRFRTQAWIRGCGRVDFLIGDRLVVEADGRAFHTGEVAHQRDVDRDNALKALGYLPYHFTYADVVSKDRYVEAILRPVISRGEHRWTQRNCLWRRSGLTDPDLGRGANWG